MKKSQLRNIIRESIKELITEHEIVFNQTGTYTINTSPPQTVTGNPGDLVSGHNDPSINVNGWKHMKCCKISGNGTTTNSTGNVGSYNLGGGYMEPELAGGNAQCPQIGQTITITAGPAQNPVGNWPTDITVTSSQLKDPMTNPSGHAYYTPSGYCTHTPMDPQYYAGHFIGQGQYGFPVHSWLSKGPMASDGWDDEDLDLDNDGGVVNSCTPPPGGCPPGSLWNGSPHCQCLTVYKKPTKSVLPIRTKK
tara:strand:+ start:46 stop:795 length:750 start_codon:yes stop_codon:yes gene_type:complete